MLAADLDSDSDVVDANCLFEAGLDKDTCAKMGREWSQFATTMLACLDLVREIPMQQNAWEGQRANQKLLQAMRPWLNAQPTPPALSTPPPTEFLSLWTTHLRSKMFYKLLGSNVAGSEVFEELSKRKFWCSGRHGILIIAAGLKWVHQKLQGDRFASARKEWAKLVKELRVVLQKMADESENRQ